MKIGIGALAKATGIPVNTLRTWERRYQVPTPVRSEGGQRLYDPMVVDQLKLIALALDRGHRPSQIMQAKMSELQALLGVTEAPIRPEEPALAPPADSEPLNRLFQAVLQTDGGGLHAVLEDQLEQEGVLPTVTHTLLPLLQRIGNAWQEGQLLPYQEHFTSELIQDVLSARWRPKAEHATGPLVLCATLPQERHQLGLHFAATVMAEAGWQVLFSGADTPVSDIEACVRARKPAAVLLSVSAVANPSETRWIIEHIRRAIAPTLLIVGGSGAPTTVDGILGIQDFSRLLQWARDFAPPTLPS